jgi:hypothetical protein
MNQRIIIVCTLSFCAAILLAACGDAAAEGRTPNSSPAGSGSADAGRLVRPPTAPPSSESPPPARCPDGARIAVDPAHPPAPICFSVGHTVHLSTAPSPYQPWETFTSSDPDVVTCETSRVPDGAAQAKCTGRKPGTAVVTTGTMPFQGDPHGPAQQTWQLTITVTP